MKSSEDKLFISVSEAMKIASDYGINITRPTALKWIKEFDLGHQPGKTKTTHWVVNSEKWEEFILNRN